MLLLECHEKQPQIDPDAPLGQISVLMQLDTHRIYGTDIWTLFIDGCDGDIYNFFAILRAVELGAMPWAFLRKLIADRNSVDVKKVRRRVEAMLPNFGKG